MLYVLTTYQDSHYYRNYTLRYGYLGKEKMDDYNGEILAFIPVVRAETSERFEYDGFSYRDPKPAKFDLKNLEIVTNPEPISLAEYTIKPVKQREANKVIEAIENKAFKEAQISADFKNVSEKLKVLMEL